MERYVRRDVQAREDAAAQAVAMGSRIIHHYDRHPPRCPACKRKVDATRLELGRKSPRVRVPP